VSVFENARLTRHRALVVAAAGALVAGLAVGPSVATPASQRSSAPSANDLTSWSGQTSGHGRGRNQTSDGKPGIVVGPPINARGR